MASETERSHESEKGIGHSYPSVALLTSARSHFPAFSLREGALDRWLLHTRLGVGVL